MERNREKENARIRERRATDPAFRERESIRQRERREALDPKIRKQRREYLRAYHTDPENRKRMNARSRERYANDPEYRARDIARKSTPEYRANYKSYRQQKYYGMTPGTFEAMFNAQGGVCCICGKPEKLYVDHCHITGEPRGLLCSPCNVGIGMLGDTSDALERALRYLQKAKQQ
jgi:hypothetical protein